MRESGREGRRDRVMDGTRASKKEKERQGNREREGGREGPFSLVRSRYHSPTQGGREGWREGEIDRVGDSEGE